MKDQLVSNYNNICDKQFKGLSKNNFVFHYVIGRGGFGKVWKVEKKKTKVLYAMKEMSKPRYKILKTVLMDYKKIGY